MAWESQSVDVEPGSVGGVCPWLFTRSLVPTAVKIEISLTPSLEVTVYTHLYKLYINVCK